MTTHYVDLRVVPDAETGVRELLGALYDKLHRALVQQRIDSIGVSFPQYSVIPRNLGDTLRLHATEDVLRTFLSGDWLRGLRDHVRSTEVTAVPAQASHRLVQRKQFKTSVERLRRRRMRRKGETAQQAAAAIPDSVERIANLPCLQLHSLSTGQPFCLFIALGTLQPEPSIGGFNSYGLSDQGSIPWF